MIELDPGDFRPLDTFRLRWRWTDPKWHLLPAVALAQIRPLTEAKAREVWMQTLGTANALFDIRRRFGRALPIAHGPFTLLRRIEAAHPHPSVVAQQLVALVALSTGPVVVVWQPTDAVEVTWEVFCAYWNSFCYPASDDGSIRPLDQKWCLEWHHDEYFLFGYVQSTGGMALVY